MPREHIVQQGESLSGIARRYGFTDWRLIYDDPSNAELKKQRPDPNILFPGDRISIPDAKPRDVSAQTGGAHQFTIQTKRRVLRLKLLDGQGRPLADEPYTLEFTGKPPMERRTGGDGLLEEPVPEASPDARLAIRGRVFRLRLGHLNPLEHAPDEGVSGAQARLGNLGYAVPPAHGKLDAATRVAIATFQADHGIEVDGNLTRETLTKLREIHGC